MEQQTAGAPTGMGRRLAHRIVSTGIVAFIGACLLAAPAVALAADGRHYTFYNPNPTFRGSLDGLAEVVANGQHALVLDRSTVWQYQVPGGGSADAVAPGNAGAILIADSAGRRAMEVSRAKSVNWSFGRADYSALAGVDFVRPTSSGYVLVDTKGRRVLQIDSDRSVTWDFSAADDSNLEAPASAQVLDDGAVLIADPVGRRVLEVGRDKHEVWHYSAAKGPVQATRLSSGETLVVDQAGDQVLSVTSSGDIAWSFGEKGVAGSDKTHLDSPKSAERLADGSTLIADAGNKRVLLVSAQGSVSEVHGTGSPFDAEKDLSATGGASLVSDGLMTADADSGLVTITGYRSSGRYSTGDLDLGIPGVNKWVTEILPSAATKAGTSLKVSYSLNGGSWKSAGSGAGFRIAEPTPAGFIRLRVDFATSDPSASPVLSALNAAFYLSEPPKWVPPKKKPSKGSGSGSGSGSGTGISAGSGSGTGGGGSGSGSGTGIGVGSGSGSGSGSGTGSGTGLGLGSLSSGGGNDAKAVAVNVPAGAAEQMLSGWVMNEKIGGSGSGDAGGGSKYSGALADPAGLIAASLMLAVAFVLGFFGPKMGLVLVKANRLAWSAIVRSIDG